MLRIACCSVLTRRLAGQVRRLAWPPDMREGGSMRGLRRVGVVLCVVGLAGKRQFVVLAILASALLMAIPAAAAADSLEASFQEFGGRAIAHPCDAFSCGTGEVEGFGSATSSFEVLS